MTPKKSVQPRSVPSRAASFALLALAGTLAFAATSGAATDPTKRGLLLDAVRVGQSVIAVGERGLIVRSSDSGQNWQGVATPSHATLTGVSFADANRGWAVGHDGTILTTDDSGGTWTIQSGKIAPDVSFLDVLAVDLRHVIAAGAFGTFYESFDAGRHWNQRTILDEELHINRLHSGTSGHVFLIGESGTLRRSDDLRSGAQALAVGYEGTLNGMVEASGTLIVYGLQGHVFRSPDRGDTWTATEGVPPVLLSAGLHHSSGTVVLAGQARVFLVSRDLGQTFERWETGLTWPVADLLEAPDGSLLAFGEEGVARIDPPDKPAEAQPTEP